MCIPSAGDPCPPPTSASIPTMGSSCCQEAGRRRDMCALEDGDISFASDKVGVA